MRKLAGLLKPSPFMTGCLVVVLSCMLFHSFGHSKPELLSSLDNQITSTMFNWRGPVETTGKVVIVDIDEKSLSQIGQWPWPRDIVARLVKAIDAAGAEVIGFDIVFAEKDRTSITHYLNDFKAFIDPELAQNLTALEQRDNLNHDITLGNAVSASPVVLGYIFQLRDDGLKQEGETPFPSITIRVSPKDVAYKDLMLIPGYRPILNIEEISQAPTEGFLNVFPDASGMVRKVPVFMELNGIPYPSLALEMVRTGMKQSDVFIHASTQKTTGKRSILGVSLNDTVIPTDDMGQVTVNFRGPVETFKYISAADIIEGRNTLDLKGRYVLIGTSASGLLDFHATPFSGIFPGVEIQATVIDNILAGDLFTYDIFTEIGLTYTFIIIGGIILSALLAYSGALAGGLAGLFFIATIISGDYYLMFLRGRLVGLTYPLVTIMLIFLIVTLFNYFFEYRKKQFIHDAFSRYVSPMVINQLMKKPERLSLRGEEKNLTILFSDIRSFTSISEGMTPQQLAAFMNTYLTAMSDIIMEHNGMVDKYIGDAIVAIWGAPLADRDHVIHAVRASIAMRDALNALRGKWVKQGFPSIEIGMGINTGMVSVGNFGSERRFEYTVLGDNVNLASRLEGLNKAYGTSIIISEFTRLALGNTFFCRFLDRVRVKGKALPIDIYEPLAEGTVDPAVKQAAELFEKALKMYRKQDFRQACRIMEELNRSSFHPLYRLYLDRIRAFTENPPGQDWDGVYTFTSK